MRQRAVHASWITGRASTFAISLLDDRDDGAGASLCHARAENAAAVVCPSPLRR